MNKTYHGSDFAVLWQPKVCIHSTVCWKNMRAVFDPTRRPWIVLENGEKEAIKKQVLACPSGALQWIEKTKEGGEFISPENITILATPLENGPLLVKGDILVVHPDGKQEKKEKQTAFCRCGASDNKPYCDGTHSKIGFKA